MALIEESNQTMAIPPLPDRFRYHVVFSYAFEEKEYVEGVRAALPKNLKVYDYQKNPLWGEVLPKGIKRIYTYEAPFCVVFFSQAYFDRSTWTKQELGIVKRVQRKKKDFILPVVIDCELPEELKKLAWLERKNFSPEQLADRIVAKIREPPRKPLWFYLSTTVKAAVVSAALALIVTLILLQPSRTRILSADANEQAITARVANIGPWSSTIVGQRLTFGTLPIEDTELRIGNRRIAPGVHDMTLTTMEILTRCNDAGIRPNYHQVEGLLGQQSATLEIDIQESNDARGRWTRRKVTFPAAHLKTLVERLVSGRDTQCP